MTKGEQTFKNLYEKLSLFLILTSGSFLFFTIYYSIPVYKRWWTLTALSIPRGLVPPAHIETLGGVRAKLFSVTNRFPETRVVYKE